MTLRSLFGVLVALCSLAAATAATSELQSLMKQAKQNYEPFQKAIMVGKALQPTNTNDSGPGSLRQAINPTSAVLTAVQN